MSKQSSQQLSKLASSILRAPNPFDNLEFQEAVLSAVRNGVDRKTLLAGLRPVFDTYIADMRRLAASVLSQDETPS